MRKNMFEPLGIKDITFFPDEHPGMKGRVASLTARGPDNGKVVPYTEPFLNYGSKDCFGGHGGYAAMTEYIKVLHSILSDDEKLLKKETAALMFQPQLTAESKRALNATLHIPEVAGMFVGDLPTTINYDWGLGGILVEGSIDGRRKKGTLIWSGMPNLFWVRDHSIVNFDLLLTLRQFIDREAGLCGVFGTQVLPPGDLKVEEMIKTFEMAMNEKLVSAKL